MNGPNPPWARRILFAILLLVDITCVIIPGFSAIFTRNFERSLSGGPVSSTGASAVNTGFSFVVVGLLAIVAVIYAEWYISNDDV